MNLKSLTWATPIGEIIRLQISSPYRNLLQNFQLLPVSACSHSRVELVPTHDNLKLCFLLGHACSSRDVYSFPSPAAATEWNTCHPPPRPGSHLFSLKLGEDSREICGFPVRHVPRSSNIFTWETMTEESTTQSTAAPCLQTHQQIHVCECRWLETQSVSQQSTEAWLANI